MMTSIGLFEPKEGSSKGFRYVPSGKLNIAMENGPFEEVFPIEHGDFPLLC